MNPQYYNERPCNALNLFKFNIATACDRDCLKPKMCLITAYCVLINKGINAPFLSIFDHMSRRGVTRAWFNCRGRLRKRATRVLLKSGIRAAYKMGFTSELA